MFRNYLLKVFQFFALVLTFTAHASNDVVPVVLWGKSGNVPSVPAFEVINEQSFSNIITENVKDNYLLVFVKESLIPNDFNAIKEGDESFKSRLESAKKDSSLSYFLFVRNPVKAIKQLYPHALEVSVSNLADNDLINSKVLIINLDDSDDQESAENMMQDVLKAFEFYKRVSESGKTVTGLLTGLNGYSSSEKLSRKVRETADATTRAPTKDISSDNRVLYSTPNVLIFVNSSIVLFVNDTNVTLSNGNLSDQVLSNNNIISTLTTTEATLRFNFTATINNYWYLSNLTVNYNANATDLKVGNIYAPLHFSYTCNNTVFYAVNNTKYNISLPGFQVQPFFNSTNNTSFGDPYNCIGFTTIPIWSGIFVTFILILILTFGLVFIMDIKTMDRFDDPKGKTITVNVSE